MTFAYTITIADPTQAANDALLTTNLKAALDAWGQYLAGSGVIDVQLGITTSAASGELGEGGSEIAVGVGADGARTVYQSGAASELATGVDPNGATDDGSIDLSSTELSKIYFSATPGTAAPPRGQYDGLSILEHELGHIFGIDGFRDDSGVLPADSESTWDQLVVVNGKTATFTGAHAVALYGAAVPVTTTYDTGEAYYHFANSTRDAASNDLMSGTGLPTAVVRSISPLDVATMDDIGTPLSSTGSLDLEAATLLRLKSFSDFTAATSSTVAALALQVDGATATLASATASLSPLAASTTAVATLSYEFFTQQTPTLAGLDFLVSPEGSDATNLNSTYYAKFNTENRFINFAVNLGAVGAGATAFATAAGPLTLSQVVTDAYTEIFGSAPSADKVAAIVGDAVPNGLGGTETRAQYFASYGLTDLGTKAAAVGWLLSQAEASDLGGYAQADDALLVALAGADVSKLGTDLLSSHSWLA